MTVAITLAGLFAALSPLALRYFKFDGLQMAAVSYLAALAIAILAQLFTGELRPTWTSLLTVLSGSAATWTIQQAVYKILVAKAPALFRPPAAPRQGQGPAQVTR